MAIRRLPRAPQNIDSGMRGFLNRLVATLEQYLNVQIQPITDSWTTSNVTTARTLDADSASASEIADVLATLIEDLKDNGIIHK